MPKHPPPDDLTPSDRLREVAAILARGVIRYRKIPQINTDKSAVIERFKTSHR